MKRNCLFLACCAIFLLQLWSCKEEMLEDFNTEKTTPVVVSAGTVSSVIGRDNEKVTVNVGLRLSAPSTKAFQVNLRLNTDTMQTLIKSGNLQNTVVLPAGYIKIPNVAEVGYGVDSVFFPIEINLTAFEQYYGKKVAIAVTLSDPSKGNQISGNQRTSVVVLDTKSIVEEQDIHYLSIKNGGGTVLQVTRGANYVVTSAGVTIPLDVSLASVPGSAFVVKSRANQDTIATLVAAGKLPKNTRSLAKDQYLLDTLINFPGNKSQAGMALSIAWNVMDENLGNPVAISVSLVSTNKHVINPAEKNVIVLIDPSVSLDNNSFITGDGTGLKAEYFKGTKDLDKGGKTPDLVRVDATINFDGWRPFEDTDDNWSSRWTGEFLAPVRGEYIFYQTDWDDGARLFVNGVTLVNDFTDEWNKPTRVGRIFLERGQRYKIEADHRENVGGQQAKLMYEVPTAGVGKQIVPKTQLFPAK